MRYIDDIKFATNMVEMYENYKIFNMGALILLNLCLLSLASNCSAVRMDRPNANNQDIQTDLRGGLTVPHEDELKRHWEDSRRVSSTNERVNTPSSMTPEEFCTKHPSLCTLGKLKYDLIFSLCACVSAYFT